MLVSNTDTGEIPRISSRPSRRLALWAGMGAAFVGGILTALSVIVGADWEPDIVALGIARLLAGVLAAVALVAWLGRQACLWIVSRLTREISRIIAMQEQTSIRLATLAGSQARLAKRTDDLESMIVEMGVIRLDAYRSRPTHG